MSPPTPLAFVLLVALLPGVWLAGSAIARRLTRDRGLARLLTPALAVAFWLTAIHGASLAARSFWIGLPIGTLLVVAGGLLLRPRPEAAAPTMKIAAPEQRAQASGRWMWLSAILATAYLAPTAIGWSFHDEVSVTGHLSISSTIVNGGYPPRHLSFPQLELRYHYGFDLLVAAVASLLRLRVDYAIDLVTLIAWGYSWCLAWAIGERLVGRNWGLATAAVTLFGGGFPFLSSAATYSSTQTPILQLLSMGGVGDDRINPPLVSYFFQHPWTLGIPLAFAAILAVSVRDAPVRWARQGAIGLLLICLSFSQTVLFVCLAGALLVVEPVADWKLGWKTALGTVLLLGGAIAVASRLHGFFAPAPLGSEAMFELRSVPLGGTPGGLAIWHLQTFGLLLPLGIAGLCFLGRERLLVSLLVVGSLLVLNVLRYRYSWDIVKFATVCSLALSLGACAALGRLFALRPPALARAAGASAIAGLVAAGVLFPFVVGFFRPDVPLARYPVALPGADANVMAWLRRNVRPGDAVFRSGSRVVGYAQWGGLPIPVYDQDTTTFGLPRHLLESRDQFFSAPVGETATLLRQRVRWVVVDPEYPEVARVVDRWIGEGQAVVRARFEPLTIVELTGPVPP